jgi:hypothetical protein
MAIAQIHKASRHSRSAVQPLPQGQGCEPVEQILIGLVGCKHQVGIHLQQALPNRFVLERGHRSSLARTGCLGGGVPARKPASCLGRQAEPEHGPSRLVRQHGDAAAVSLRNAPCQR